MIPKHIMQFVRIFSWLRALMNGALVPRAACIVPEAGSRADIARQV